MNWDIEMEHAETIALQNLHEKITIESDSTAEKDKIRRTFFNLIDNFIIDGVQVSVFLH